MKKANKAYTDGDLKTALTLYHRAAELAPDNIEIRLNLGVVAVNAGAPKHAEAAFRAVLSAQPNHKMAVYNLGLLLGDMGRVKEAIQYLKRAIKLIPDDPAPALALATVHITSRQLKAAEKLLKRMKPQTTHVLSLRAFAALRGGDVKHASVMAQKAQALQPTAPKVLILQATVLLHSGQLEQAGKLLQRLIQSQPGGPANVPYLLGLCSFLKGDFQDAASWHSEADARVPGAFDPAHPGFDSNAFATDSDIAFLNWAKKASKAPPLTSGKIINLRTQGKNCHPGVIMATLAEHMNHSKQCQKSPAVPLKIAVKPSKSSSNLTVNPKDSCWEKVTLPKSRHCETHFEVVPRR